MNVISLSTLTTPANSGLPTLLIIIDVSTLILLKALREAGCTEAFLFFEYYEIVVLGIAWL
jgi:hypothetical protein